MSPKIRGVNRKDLVIKAKKLKIREASKLSIKGLEDAVNKAIRKRNSQKKYIIRSLNNCHLEGKNLNGLRNYAICQTMIYKILLDYEELLIMPP